MRSRLSLDILAQPDDTTCGPTCLHAVYRYYGDDISLEDVIDETPRLAHGGTLAVLLALHALRRGYRATIYTYNLRVFDPTWFGPNAPDMRDRLLLQMKRKREPRMRTSCRAYIDFLNLGGRLRLRDLSRDLIRRTLDRGKPILTGLSATFLYREMRERDRDGVEDDIRGEPSGHFVVLCGYDREERTVSVADPLESNPMARTRRYEVSMDRLVGAILLGVVTYDANLLIIEPSDSRGDAADVDDDPPESIVHTTPRAGAAAKRVKGVRRASARRRQ